MPEAIYNPTLKRVSVELADEILVKRNIDELFWSEIVSQWLQLRGFRPGERQDWKRVGDGYRCKVVDLIPVNPAALTQRQRRVVQLFSIGKSPTEVAKALGITKPGLDGLRTRVGERLGTRNIADWTRYAIRIGLIDGEERTNLYDATFKNRPSNAGTHRVAAARLFRPKRTR